MLNHVFLWSKFKHSKWIIFYWITNQNVTDREPVLAAPLLPTILLAFQTTAELGLTALVFAETSGAPQLRIFVKFGAQNSN